ncbi:DUF2750 domain-containing protein [Paenibacillus dendritiformis]|uniref:DUF2750 domain-containing protein n=1 Tax=Paenibacillus dendritiformis TaxID=130049 RepID=UPI00387E12B1
MGKGFESSPEFKAMIKKSARDRYIYSVKRIADWEEAWSLELNDGFVTTSDNEGNLSMPIWPFKEYAMKCIGDEWENCKTQFIYKVMDWQPLIYQIAQAPSIRLLHYLKHSLQ